MKGEAPAEATAAAPPETLLDMSPNDRPLPTFLLPGAQKSGTTSLYKALKQHPDCLMSDVKEPNYFTRKSNLVDLDSYRAYFAGTDQPLNRPPTAVGEASTVYMIDENVPGRIHDLLGDEVRFVFTLRNPVDRAVSAYWHLSKKFDELREIEECFDFSSGSRDAVLEEEKRILRRAETEGTIKTRRLQDKYDDYRMPFRYVTNSFYTVHLRRFLEYFSREKMHVLFLHDLRTHPEQTFSRVCEFLGLDASRVPEVIHQKQNRGVVPRKGPLSRLLHAVRPIAARVLPRNQTLIRLFHRLGFKPRPKVPQDLRGRLEPLFEQETLDLENLLDRPVPPAWPRPAGEHGASRSGQTQ